MTNINIHAKHASNFSAYVDEYNTLNLKADGTSVVVWLTLEQMQSIADALTTRVHELDVRNQVEAEVYQRLSLA